MSKLSPAQAPQQNQSQNRSQKRPLRKTGIEWLDVIVNSGFRQDVCMTALLASLGVPFETAMTCFASVEDMMVGRLPDRDSVERLMVEITTAMRKTPQERMAALVDVAIRHKEAVMLEPGDSSQKDKVASEILDRVVGKPTQTIVSQNLNLSASVGDLKQVDQDLAAIMSQIQKLEHERKLLSGCEAAKVKGENGADAKGGPSVPGSEQETIDV